jgi:hypothetical protein
MTFETRRTTTVDEPRPTTDRIQDRLTRPAPALVTCPQCGAALAVAAGGLGQPVQCGLCESVFLALTPEPPPPRRRVRPHYYEVLPPADGADWDRCDLAPHRSSLLMLLAIFSLAGAVLVVPGLAGGVTTLTLATRDLRAMRAERMDPEGEPGTSLSRILGGLAVIVAGVLGVAFLLMVCR